MKPNHNRMTHDRLRSLEQRAMVTETGQASIARAVVALMRRIFRHCRGKPVNTHSRQMTPEEALELHGRLVQHGVIDEEVTPDPKSTNSSRR